MGPTGGTHFRAIEQAVAHLVPGGVSDIIESPEGIQIIRMDDRKPKQFRRYEDARREIQELVFSERAKTCISPGSLISRTKRTSRSNSNKSRKSAATAVLSAHKHAIT